MSFGGRDALLRRWLHGVLVDDGGWLPISPVVAIVSDYCSPPLYVVSFLRDGPSMASDSKTGLAADVRLGGGRLYNGCLLEIVDVETGGLHSSQWGQWVPTGFPLAEPPQFYGVLSGVLLIYVAEKHAWYGLWDCGNRSEGAPAPVWKSIDLEPDGVTGQSIMRELTNKLAGAVLTINTGSGADRMTSIAISPNGTAIGFRSYSFDARRWAFQILDLWVRINYTALKRSFRIEAAASHGDMYFIGVTYETGAYQAPREYAVIMSDPTISYGRYGSIVNGSERRYVLMSRSADHFKWLFVHTDSSGELHLVGVTGTLVVCTQKVSLWVARARAQEQSEANPQNAPVKDDAVMAVAVVETTIPAIPPMQDLYVHGGFWSGGAPVQFGGQLHLFSNHQCLVSCSIPGTHQPTTATCCAAGLSRPAPTSFHSDHSGLATGFWI